jgi:hypothetical protein
MHRSLAAIPGRLAKNGILCGKYGDSLAST